MKNIFKYLSAFALTVALVGCDPAEEPQFDNVNGQTAISLAQTSLETSVPQEDLSIDIPVFITTIAGVERSYSATVVEADGTGEVAVGQVTIPANSYEGVLEVNFDFSAIGGEDGELRNAIVQLEPSNGATAYNDVLNITYFREIICNDTTLSVQFDAFGDETAFDIVNKDTGMVVFSRPLGSFGFSNPPPVRTFDITLPDGCYEFTIADSFGDGQDDTGAGGVTVGSFDLTCSIITLATGGGTAVSDAITSDQISRLDPFGLGLTANSTVQVVEFCVNP
ncbi:MAG: hypothetical protein WBA16_11325 [Nonlabens sp.]